MFEIRPFEARTLRWWFGNRDRIDMQPPYQRQGKVWNARTRAYLIDSVLNDFDIPKFYLADFTYVNGPLNVTKKHYAVIDGRQRLESIFAFFLGELRLNSDFVLADDESLALGGASFDDLRNSHPTIAEKFENFNPTVMSVITDDEAKINSLFIRLNSSEPLTAAEYRNALPGPASQLIREIADHDFFTHRVRFIDGKKRQHRELAAKLLLIEFKDEIVDTKRSQLDKMVMDAAFAAQSTGNIVFARDRVVKNLDKMVGVFGPSDPLLRSQGPTLPYYLFVRRVYPENGIRPFLEFIEDSAQALRRGEMTDNLPAWIYTSIAHYDALRRNINDASSIVGRYQILLELFAAVRQLDEILQEN